MKLETTNHRYYCSSSETENITEFNNWNEFIKLSGYTIDLDCNLPIRYDIKEYKKNKFTLEIHFAQQRHGKYLWHIVINNIKNEDMKEIEIYLLHCWQHLKSLWPYFYDKQKEQY